MTELSDLTFNTFERANRLRLPQFKNKHGEAAHAKADGSDWNPAQWFEALIGELGEFATERIRFELGYIDADTYRERAAKELADAFTYLVLLSTRALDFVPQEHTRDRSQQLLAVIAALGEYANASKKQRRGDIAPIDFEAQREKFLNEAISNLYTLRYAFIGETSAATPVFLSEPTGVNIAAAVEQKFNEVSLRVSADVFISGDLVHNAKGELL
jgi:hypothetical protein